MTVITVPSNDYWSDASLILRRGSVVLRSKYTGKRQVLSLPFALWVFEGKLIKMTSSAAAPWRSFFVQLDGQANTFKLNIPGIDGVPLSGYSGTEGTVSGASQTGASLTTHGWTPSAKLLNEGDYFTVNDELKVATADVYADGTGIAVLPFKPTLRTSPPDASQVYVKAPYVVLAAQSDDVAAWKLTHPVIHDMELKAIEAF